MPDTGLEPVDVLHITYLVADDGKTAISFADPLAVVIGPGGPGDTYAEVEADIDALTDGKDKLDCVGKLRQKLLGWALDDAACEKNEEKLKKKIRARAIAEAADPKKAPSITVGEAVKR